MTVLCLAETDADGAADASLRALSFAAVPARFPGTRWRPTGRPAPT